jgi:hypothetical protein
VPAGGESPNGGAVVKQHRSTSTLGTCCQNIARSQNQSLGDKLELGCSDKTLAMIVPLRHLLGWIFTIVSSRENLILENLSLRQQLLALHVKRPQRRLTARHKLFWVMLRKLWSGLEEPSHLGYAKNRHWLASCRLSPVLEMALKSQISGRT